MINGSAQRVPLTITLDRESYKFVESCARLKEFRSVDELFEAALNFYGKQIRALHAYTEMQIDRGFTREEALRSLELEFVFTQPARNRAD